METLIETVEKIAGENLREGIVREERLIRDIAMLRSQSKNGYSYSSAAMQAAARLFEGAPAYLDHPSLTGVGAQTVRQGVAAGTGAGHSVRDRVGRFSNVRLAGDLVRGDLHLLPGPDADRILALAEEMPEAVGFSIEAQGTMAVLEGRKIVTDLTAAKGVALVTEPAATRGLFESRQALRAPVRVSRPDPAVGVQTLQEQVDSLREDDPELYQWVVAAEDRRRESIRAAARRQRLVLSEATVARLAAHGSLEHVMQLMEALAADVRTERIQERSQAGAGTAGSVQSLPARPNDSKTQIEVELAQRLIAAD
ncbi:MAG TPA: hypothetical protein VL860_12005 [Planctomycetota bacterium]|nr:hypothetical protein [Planctomycetota bacterium]